MWTRISITPIVKAEERPLISNPPMLDLLSVSLLGGALLFQQIDLRSARRGALAVSN